MLTSTKLLIWSLLIYSSLQNCSSFYYTTDITNYTTTGENKTVGKSSTITGDISTITDEISTITNEISTATDETRAVTGEISTNTGEISTITGETSTVNGETSTKTGVISTVTGETSRATDETNTVIDEISSITGETSTATGRISTTTGEISTTTGEISTITNEVNTATGGISTVTDEISTATDVNVTSENFPPCLDGAKEVYPPNKYPFFVKVEGFGISCGGALITKKYVLSAAQCLPKHARKDLAGRIDYETVQGFVVYVGVFNKSDEQNAYPASSMTQFPGYDNNPNADILLIELYTVVDTNGEMKPINLPYDPRLEAPEVEITVTGWNITSPENCSANEALKEVKLKVLPPSFCFTYYDVSQYTFCAGYPDAGACLGDIGGPVFVEINNNYYLIGIVSEPGICAAKPGRYTKVSVFNTWIERNMKNGKLKTELPSDKNDMI